MNNTMLLLGGGLLAGGSVHLLLTLALLLFTDTCMSVCDCSSVSVCIRMFILVCICVWMSHGLTAKINAFHIDRDPFPKTMLYDFSLYINFLNRKKFECVRDSHVSSFHLNGCRAFTFYIVGIVGKYQIRIYKYVCMYVVACSCTYV